MRILFKQPKEGNGANLLRCMGIERCYVKHILHSDGRAYVTRKRHHHTDFEIHIVERGSQVYEIGGKEITVSAGQLLLIPPAVKHCALRESADASKYSVIFGLSESAVLCGSDVPFVGDVPDAVWENLHCIRTECERRARDADTLLSLRAIECVLRLLRLAESTGKDLAKLAPEEDAQDARLVLAKQYVADNISRPIGVSELSSYCSIGEKQLTRLFLSGEGIPPAEYIRKQRCAEIERLLRESTLPLREVSEQMNFPNEYYFNAFFKKHAGMTPGAFRRSMRKK